MIYTALGDLVTLLSLILSPVTTFALALWYISQFSKHNRAAFSAPLIFLILCPLMEYSHWNPYISSGFQVQHQCLRDILLITQTRLGLSVTYSHSSRFISLHIVSFYLIVYNDLYNIYLPVWACSIRQAARSMVFTIPNN